MAVFERWRLRAQPQVCPVVFSGSRHFRAGMDTFPNKGGLELGQGYSHRSAEVCPLRPARPHASSTNQRMLKAFIDDPLPGWLSMGVVVTLIKFPINPAVIGMEVLLAFQTVQAQPTRVTVDRSRSHIIAVTFRSGSLGFLGHEHALLATEWSADICHAPDEIR